MRIAYADPPYPGQAARHYNCAEIDHEDLLRVLVNDYDGWLLHTSSTALPEVLAIAEKFTDDYRVMAWVKPFCAFKRNVSVAYAWEPVLVKACRKPVVRHRVVMRDFISENITMKKGLTGAKPEKVCWWAFEMLGLEPTDELDDLYPGPLNTVTNAWKKWQEMVDNEDRA